MGFAPESRLPLLLSAADAAGAARRLLGLGVKRQRSLSPSWKNGSFHENKNLSTWLLADSLVLFGFWLIEHEFPRGVRPRET